MICKETGCGGEIDAKKNIPLRVSCHLFGTAHPCGKCGRLHWAANGEAAPNRLGNHPFLFKGKVILKDEEGNVVFEHPMGR